MVILVIWDLFSHIESLFSFLDCEFIVTFLFKNICRICTIAIKLVTMATWLSLYGMVWAMCVCGIGCPIVS